MTVDTQAITYAREILSPEFAAEITPLLEAHNGEVDPFPQYPVDPDWDFYYLAQASGFLRIFTARDASGLIGYSVSFIRNDPHHRTSTRAMQALFFIHPQKRGFGEAFLLWCNEQLKAEGADVDFQHISVKCDWSKMAARAGYVKVEEVWAKVL